MKCISKEKSCQNNMWLHELYTIKIIRKRYKPSMPSKIIKFIAAFLMKGIVKRKRRTNFQFLRINHNHLSRTYDEDDNWILSHILGL